MEVFTGGFPQPGVVHLGRAVVIEVPGAEARE